MTADVKVQCNGWCDSFSTDFIRAALHRLAIESRRLRDTLKGEARFVPLEHQLILVFEGDGRGHIKVSGKAVYVHHSGSS